MARILQISFLVLLLGGLALWQRPDGKLHVIFFETAGDAVFIQTPNGAHILIDGGSDPSALTAAIGRRLPFWQRQLDAVILTSPDGQHLPGQVAALARYQVQQVVAMAQAKPNATMREWQRLLTQAGQRFKPTKPGVHLVIDNVRFDVLAIDSETGQGMVMRITYGKQMIVLAHSISQASEAQLAAVANANRVALLSYPWQRDPNNPFVTELQPAVIVFTDGQSEKHPAQLTIPERAIGGAALYHERLHGEIEWVGDGRTASVVVARNYCSPLTTTNVWEFMPFQSRSASCNSRARS